MPFTLDMPYAFHPKYNLLCENITFLTDENIVGRTTAIAIIRQLLNGSVSPDFLKSISLVHFSLFCLYVQRLMNEFL